MSTEPDLETLQHRLRELETEAGQGRRATAINQALFSISAAVNTIDDLGELARTIQRTLSAIIDTAPWVFG